MNEHHRYWTPNSETGFISPNALACFSELPGCWQWAKDLSSSVGNLSDHELLHRLNDCPVVSINDLSDLDISEQEFLLRFFAILACHRIHRPAFKNERFLPKSVSVPLWHLSQLSGRPPGLTYASYVLCNFKDFPGPNSSPDVFKIQSTPTGTPDEEWFVAVHLAVESYGGIVVQSIKNIEQALNELDFAQMAHALNSIAQAICTSRDELSKVRDRMAPEVFRNRIRPLLHGFENLLFEGVPEPNVLSYVGETGAQSGIIRAVDAVLVPEHSPSVSRHQQAFLQCAPPAHREFIKTASGLGARLSQSQAHSRLVCEARNHAIHELREFRRSHLKVVTEFLVRDGKQLATKGTGGTPLNSWLDQLIKETESSNNGK